MNELCFFGYGSGQNFCFFMDIKINNDNKKKMEGLKIKKQDEIKINFFKKRNEFEVN